MPIADVLGVARTSLTNATFEPMPPARQCGRDGADIIHADMVTRVGAVDCIFHI